MSTLLDFHIPRGAALPNPTLEAAMDRLLAAPVTMDLGRPAGLVLSVEAASQIIRTLAAVRGNVDAAARLLTKSR